MKSARCLSAADRGVTPCPQGREHGVLADHAGLLFALLLGWTPW